MATKSKPDQDWLTSGQIIYGSLRQLHDHEATITRMMLLAPDVADWIDEYQHRWEREYRTA